MKYCSNCGAQLPEGTSICRSCGQGVSLVKPQQQGSAPLGRPGAAQSGATGNAAAGGQIGNAAGAPAWRQGSQAPPQISPQAPSGGPSGKTGILIGCGIMLVLAVIVLIVGGIGIFLWSSSEEEAAKPSTQQTQSAAPGAQGKPSVQNSAAWNDLVREKDEIDIAIGEVAGRANQHLNRYPDFRNAPGLLNDARYALDRAKKAQERALALEGVEPARRNALAALFGIEVQRAQGLYKGMVDSSNGGDYSYGFSDGTRASYAFDEANAQFNSLYK